MNRKFEGTVVDSKNGRAYAVKLILDDMKEIGRRQVKKTRYAPGARGEQTDWVNDPLLRVAMAIGTTAYNFYQRSCVVSDQTSEAHKAHRVTDAVFRDRVVAFVKSVLPEFEEAYGSSLDGRKPNGERDNASLWKKIWNCAYFAEFERQSGDLEAHAGMYAQATMLLFLSTDKLRECGISPVTAGGAVRPARELQAA